MSSLGKVLERLELLIGTYHLTSWEDRFVRKVVAGSDHGRAPLKLTINQIARLEELYRKHFPDARAA